MRKYVFLLTATVLSLLLLSSVGYTDISDTSDDGKVQMTKSQVMIEKGKMMQASKFDDKATMVAEGKKMVDESTKMTETGMQMNSTKGKANLQSMGMKMRHCGDLLVKKGEQK